MAEYRRYRPRRNSSQDTNWRRWLVIGIGVVIVFFVAKMAFSGKKETTNGTSNTNNANVEIRLVTDNTNTTVSNTNVTLNTNSTTNTNTVATTPTSWSGFAVNKCTTAISNYGTAKRAVLTVGFSAANESVAQVIASLKEAGVPADFFVSGSFATKNPDVVKSATTAGFPVYSQSFDSTDLTKLSDADVTTTITKTETAIVDATGVTSKPIFRPPAGSYTTNTLKLLRQAGYCAVLWTVDSYDWQDGMTPTLAKERVMTAVNKQKGGSIIALHAGYEITPQLITDLVAELKTQGYEIVSLETLLNT